MPALLSPETTTSHRGSNLVVPVVMTPPGARLVATERRAVKPLVHAPDAVQPARVGGVGVIDHAVLQRECAHAGSFAQKRRLVGSGHRRVRLKEGEKETDLTHGLEWDLAPDCA